MKNANNRKTIRLKNADYNGPGAFFLTICTKDRKCILSDIFVGTGVPDGPFTRVDNTKEPFLCQPEDMVVQLKPCGEIAKRIIEQLNDFYADISVVRYVIMPNHIHLLLFISPSEEPWNDQKDEQGPSRTPVPTGLKNSKISNFVSTFKRFCNKEYGKNIWQSRSYDHIIRSQQDYEEHIRYIYENPIRWYLDELYSQEDV